MSEQTVAEEVVRRMLAADAFSAWLGIELLEIAPGNCKVRMRVREPGGWRGVNFCVLSAPEVARASCP